MNAAKSACFCCGLTQLRILEMSEMSVCVGINLYRWKYLPYVIKRYDKDSGEKKIARKRVIVRQQGKVKGKQFLLFVSERRNHYQTEPYTMPYTFYFSLRVATNAAAVALWHIDIKIPEVVHADRKSVLFCYLTHLKQCKHWVETMLYLPQHFNLAICSHT